jgi:DNA-binding MarR family transcriptional regulator
MYMHLSGMDKQLNRLPNLPCMCANFRRSARALTQLYDDALRPLGLRTTQFTILQALSLAGEVSQGQVGEILALDSTTLTRTLAIMKRQKWIATRRGRDRRERLLSLSEAGREQLERASPTWQGVQDRLRLQLGDERWRALFEQNREMTLVAKAELTSIAKGGLS